MMRHNAFKIGRLPSTLVLLLHMAVVGAAPLADAVLDIESRAFAFSHVESEDSKHCAPPHDHLFCQLCRVIGGGAIIEPESDQWLAWFDTPAEVARPLATHFVRAAPVSGVGPRAPPYS